MLAGSAWHHAISESYLFLSLFSQLFYLHLSGVENSVQGMGRNRVLIVSVCAWERDITTACAWKTRRKNLLLSLVLDIASWEYNYMCTRCPVLSLSWREAQSSVAWYGNNVLKCILNFETDRQRMCEIEMEADRNWARESIWNKKCFLQNKSDYYH